MAARVAYLSTELHSMEDKARFLFRIRRLLEAPGAIGQVPTGEKSVEIEVQDDE